MDPRYSTATREDLYNIQMELKQIQVNQNAYAERLLRLEKRQADDVAIKSVWNSPFPGVLGGTPQQGPVQTPHSEIFDDLDEQGEQLLGSLHLGPAEEEPTRRGAASRANSVRFDESALQGSSWGGGGGGHNSRHSGDFGPSRPGSGLMMERTLSHKSDGRHSSAGHSVHSHHSVASGRASSIGMDTNFPADDDEDDEPFEMPGPPVSFFVLGTVPSVVRCWLTPNYAHNTLLYADICSGAQKSTVEYALLKELDLEDDVERDVDGVQKVRLSVYFAEAIVTQHSNRSSGSEGSVPSITALFEVVGGEQPLVPLDRKMIRIFIGSDALRAHSADILFSSNTMVLLGDERERLRVPFVRPEDDAVFKYITTCQVPPEKPRLNANAAPFVFGDHASSRAGDSSVVDSGKDGLEGDDTASQSEAESSGISRSTEPATRPSRVLVLDSDTKAADPIREGTESERGTDRGESIASEASRKEPAAGIWGSWRNGHSGSGDREPAPVSGYQPATRTGRNMKILKAPKSAFSAGRSASTYDPPHPSSRPGSEGRRKSQVSVGEVHSNGTPSSRWDAKRTVSLGTDQKSQSASSQTPSGTREGRAAGTMPRSANNPVGGASAFSWMTPIVKPSKTPPEE